MKTSLFFFSVLLAVFFFTSSCKKGSEIFLDPYSGAKSPLGITFNNSPLPVPSEGNGGTIVTFSVSGLVPYKDKVVFMFNGEVAEIVEITESTIKVKVPISASSGATSLTVDNQVFFGPQFKVLGKVSIDPYFKGLTGANGTVYGYYKLTDGRLLLAGDFSTLNGIGSVLYPVNKIALTTVDYELDRSFRFGDGVYGSLQTITATANQSNYIIGGNFGGYDRTRSYISNITRLRNNGTMDTVQVKTFLKRIISVPAFNGGVDGVVLKVFNYQNKILTVGNFRNYFSRRYNLACVPYTYTRDSIKIINGLPTIINYSVTVIRDSVTIDNVPANQVVKLNIDGSLDKSYHFNTESQTGYEGGNGSIIYSFMQQDGKLILVGAFSKFDNEPSGHIVRLNLDGRIDNTFQVGTGANGNISSITYNNTTGKFLVTGIFGSFNNQPAQGIVLLNSDGSTDNSFKSKDFDSGYPTFSQQLSNGLIVVGGTFKKYNGIKRTSLIILTPDGNLAPGYNTTGDFVGSITNIIEGVNPDGKLTVCLLGRFSAFNGLKVSNILRLALEN